METPATPALDFAVEDVVALSHVAVPTLGFRVRIGSGGREIRSLSLNVQLRIEARRRAYDQQTKPRLTELFGEPERWDTTLRSLLWTQVAHVVPAFTDETVVEIPVPCTYDFDVVATRYIDPLSGGEVPLELLFSGTMFYSGDGGRLQAAHVPWDREAAHRMPVAVWREAMEVAFPGTVWLRLGRESFDRLHDYKAAHALPGWDAAIDRLVGEAEGA